MKVVLLALNAKYVHSSLSVWYLAKAVSLYSDLPHVIDIVESNVNKSEQEIANSVIEYAPDVVGISTYIWNAEKMMRVLEILRCTLPNTISIAGGPEASHNPQHWLAHGVDYVICADGERAFPILLDRLSLGEKPEKLIVIPFEEIWPDPYDDMYFNALEGKIAYLETSRGCPFSCEFCLSGEDNVRFLPLDIAKKRLYKLSNSGSRTIKLVDRTFNSNLDRTYKLIEYILELNTDCCFHFEVAADLFDDKILELLVKAKPGRIQIEAGLQSFNKKTLEAVSRKTNLDKAENNIRVLLKSENIHVHIDLIAGLPYEDLYSFKNSFDRAYSIGAHTLQLGFLKLLHGSKLREKTQRMNISYEKIPPYEIISSQWLSVKDLEIIKQTEVALHNTYNKGRFRSALNYLLSETPISPFELFCVLGKMAKGNTAAPEMYANAIYNYSIESLGLDEVKIKDRLIYDWLAAMKGKNMPAFLKIKSRHRKNLTEKASEILGYKIDRDCLAILSSGNAVFVDCNQKDPITGLYKLYTITPCVQCFT